VGESQQLFIADRVLESIGVQEVGTGEMGVLPVSLIYVGWSGSSHTGHDIIGNDVI
jgi:hypothetical protein